MSEPAETTEALEQSDIDALVMPEQGWMRSLARKYARIGVSREELESEGMVGLLEAAKRFDRKVGVKFSTYARYWVRARMLGYIRVNQRAVSPPSSRKMRKLRLHLRRAERELEQEMDGQVTDAALAERLDVEVEDVQRAREVLSRRDMPLSNGQPAKGHYEPREWRTPEDEAMTLEQRRRYQDLASRALDALDERERLIVRHRIMRTPKRTLREIGEDLGITRERVRQLQVRALRKMKSALRGRAAA